MKYFKKIVGERLYLSPLNLEDAPIYTKWVNDYAVSQYISLHSRVVGLSTEAKLLEELANNYNFAIVRGEDDTLMGSIGLNDISHISRRATLGIFIGEEENRGKGYGAEAIRLILDYGFKTLNLNNVMLQCYSDNEKGLACYRKVGFKEIGRRRESCFKDGRYVDDVYMDILAREL